MENQKDLIQTFTKQKNNVKINLKSKTLFNLPK